MLNGCELLEEEKLKEARRTEQSREKIEEELSAK
jgi:hypothetical protein